VRGVVLSGRLRAAASFIEAGSRVIDVGTDHGRLPVWLVQNHITDL
jgi:tRNA (adenine22-N1)-methyltransferase